MLLSVILTPALLLGVANAATLGKRWSKGEAATGTTDPNVASGCTYWANSVTSSDTCASLNAYFGITTAQLVSWVRVNFSPLRWSYCVEAPAVKTTTSKTTTTTSKTTTTTPAITTTTSTSTTSVWAPYPTQTGLISTCNAFYDVQSGDYCQGIVTAYGNFTLSQFYQWNPAVKTDCSGLQTGYYVCIGVAGSTTTTTAAPTSTTATTTANPYSPQQTGIAANCNKYYFVETGDACANIASTYGITLANFYSWNPAVGTSCQSLQAGYYVCVGVSGSTTSTTTTKTTTTTTTNAPTTTTTASGPSPTQAGITADCETFYQAVSGDSCWTIVSEKYTYLTQDEFYAWNPAVGSTCSNLQAGYYYCVATKTVHAMPSTISTCKKWHLVATGDSCWSIEQQYGITATQFGTWNPYVGTSCASLWLGYYVCVGV
ncbi:putative LysM domain protein [Aspergillus udagawae]|uniref:LysM domain-containing protein n=1 Tax=Aspergillus udagawae TaxID=91492 RepID=A0A8E0QRC5_9EURO|nr:uncharacterized protein Aud_005456 [Aspergillus udagawae]GIC89055.1 hypothetical protein Aud_005456 [Aspergillus udagawae]